MKPPTGMSAADIEAFKILATQRKDLINTNILVAGTGAACFALGVFAALSTLSYYIGVTTSSEQEMPILVTIIMEMGGVLTKVVTCLTIGVTVFGCIFALTTIATNLSMIHTLNLGMHTITAKYFRSDANAPSS